MMHRTFRWLAAALISVAIAAPGPAGAYELNYNTIWLATSKMNPLFDPDSVIDSFMQLFRPSVWQHFHDNEFVYKQKEAETLPVLKKMVADYDLDQPVTFVGNLHVGDYDFARHAFPVSDFNENHYWTVQQSCCADIPHQIKIYLANSSLLEQVPMPENAARTFVDRAKTPNGVSRNVNARIFFVPRKLAGEDEVTGDVVKVVFLDPHTGETPLATVTPQDPTGEAK